MEDQQAEEERDHGESDGIEQGGGRPMAGAEIDGAETFNDGGHRVSLHPGAIFFGDAGEAIDDGGAIHEQLDAKADEELKVAILGSEGGDDDATAEAEQSHDDEQHGRQPQNAEPVGLN